MNDAVSFRARRQSLRLLGGGVAALLLPLTAGARGLVDTIPRVRPSVVAVGTFQRTRNPSFRFLGTGFVVGNGLTVATNAHVLPKEIAHDRLETIAIAVPAGNRIAVRPARIAAREDQRDLAVLRIEGNALPALSLAGEAPVNEGQEIAFTGFPIGNVLGFSPVTHRGIIASITPIGIPQRSSRDLDPAMIRRLGTDPFRVYQLDATAYPGNSGSPVFDPENGRVLGVINMVFVKSTKENVLSDPSGISYAVPIEYLKAMLARLE